MRSPDKIPFKNRAGGFDPRISQMRGSEDLNVDRTAIVASLQRVEPPVAGDWPVAPIVVDACLQA